MKLTPTSFRHGRFRQGFSLLEMVIVLALIGLAIGGAITMFVVTSSERELKSAAGEVEMMAKKARMLAMVQQTPYAITFSEQSVRLGPLAEAGYTEDDLKARMDFENENRSNGVASPKFSPVRESHRYEEFIVGVRRWGAVNWAEMRKNDVQVWRFDPNGICEPVAVRMEYDKGWIEMEFHPLSASVRERSMEARR